MITFTFTPAFMLSISRIEVYAAFLSEFLTLCSTYVLESECEDILDLYI